MKPIYFASPSEWRTWLERHHANRDEILVGFYKRATGQPSLTWPESVDEALCFGWIDGIRRRVDADRYTIRFTPRRAGSIWSLVNTKRVAELKADPAAWKFFKSRPPGYQRLTSWWVISASKEETRLKRLGTLIACCAAGRPIGRLTPK